MSHLVPGKKKVTNGREAFKGVFGKRMRNGGLPGRHCSTGKLKTKKKKNSNSNSNERNFTVLILMMTSRAFFFLSLR